MHLSLYVTCLCAALVSCAEEDLGEVIFVNIVYRHGDRTPVDPYPNDPYKNTSYWPAGWGELTDKGKRGHYELGKWLRQRYNTLLPMKYQKHDIHVQSTDVDRTLMSAYSNLAGMYEPDLDNNWSPDIKWQPIPVHTVPESSDHVLAAKKPCPKYQLLLSQVKASDVFQKINEQYHTLYEYLSSNSGLKVADVGNVETLYNTLFIEDLNNMTLPNWTSTVYPQPTKLLADLSFTVDCYTKSLARLKVGPLIGEIVKHMEAKAGGKLKPNRKACVYSGHDMTVANVLQGLGVFQPHSPPYLSLVLFELRRKDDKHFVTLYYRNSSVVAPMLLTVPGCQQLCPLDTFKHLVSPIIPLDWEAECKLHTLYSDLYNDLSSTSLVTSVILVAILLAMVLLVMHVYKRQCYPKYNFIYHSLNMEAPS